MNREFKFRLYSDKLKTMYSPETKIHNLWSIKEAENGIIKIDEGNILMQFTGLKDRNGKDIYEGDIVRILYTDWASKSESDERTLQQYLIDISNIGVIEFNEDRFCVKIKSKKYSDFNYSSIFAGQHGYIEVIGNIYENPELIN